MAGNKQITLTASEYRGLLDVLKQIRHMPTELNYLSSNGYDESDLDLSVESDASAEDRANVRQAVRLRDKIDAVTMAVKQNSVTVKEDA